MGSAVILFSGGLDSTVMLSLALAEKKKCFPLFFSYGQRHHQELNSAKKIAAHYGLQVEVMPLLIPGSANSSLTSALKVPTGRSLTQLKDLGVPNTYVPARNTLFLAYATGFAEMWDAEEIYFGCNKMDMNNYPDCRKEFVNAFQGVLAYATKQSISNPVKLITPLATLDKRAIVKLGRELKAPLEWTWSCYSPKQELPCEICDACILRNDALATS